MEYYGASHRGFYRTLLTFGKTYYKMTAPDTPKIYRKKRRPAHIPEYLVYEIIDGLPYYYKGYRDVLNKTKTLEEIMGCSSYQWTILEYLLQLLFAMPGRSNYR